MCVGALKVHKHNTISVSPVDDFQKKSESLNILKHLPPDFFKGFTLVSARGPKRFRLRTSDAGAVGSESIRGG